MSQQPKPTLRVARRSNTRTTLASCVLVAAGSIATPGAVAQTAPTPPKTPIVKPVKISASQAPKTVDLPGKDRDAVQVAYVAGAQWAVDGAVVTFAAKAKTAKVPTGGKSSVTVNVTAISGNTLAADITGWTLPYSTDTSTVAALVGANLPIGLDYPGVAKDAVMLTAVPGIVWSINGIDIAAFKGTKTFVMAKIIDTHNKKATTKVPAYTGSNATVTPALEAGYEWSDGGTTSQTFTTALGLTGRTSRSSLRRRSTRRCRSRRTSPAVPGTPCGSNPSRASNGPCAAANPWP